ncbi:MAG: hypothetical protein AB7G17_04160 [Phycisphaerales bacterium]
MNVARFFEHWSLSEDPFRAEEARQDPVFLLAETASFHPDFDKILGDLDRPTTAIVCGEKGSGKTAIRLQIERLIEQRNATRDDRRVLLVPYDDLNPFLDRIASRIRPGKDDLFKSIRLVDHMDGVLITAATDITDALLDDPDAHNATAAFLRNRKRDMRRLPEDVKTDLLALQAVYDASPRAASRTRALRRLMGARGDRAAAMWSVAAVLVWALPLAVLALWLELGTDRLTLQVWAGALAATLAVCALVAFRRLVLDRWTLLRTARRLLAQVRVLNRSKESLADSLALLPREARDASSLPLAEGDDRRFDMFRRLRRCLAALDSGACLIVVDRVDEPTLVAGDPDRMRALVWPMLNNKFLQMDGFGVKLLLPIELRYSLYRESAAFFQEARLDKQNLVDRLAWTGVTLYDLCSARLVSCLKPSATSITLRDLFEDDVARQDLVDALDQMRRPRDAFKLLYRCVQEHCAAITDDEPRWKIPRHVLETVRKREQERVDQLNRGVRPA